MLSGHGEEIALKTSEPAHLEQLRRSAIITSSIASCAIENIHAPHFEERMTSPIRSLTREERELAHNKKALEFVYQTQEIMIEPDFLRTLHRLAMADALQLPKYVSLEEIIDQQSDDYYRALLLSSGGWHDGIHNLEPLLRFQTSTCENL